MYETNSEEKKCSLDLDQWLDLKKYEHCNCNLNNIDIYIYIKLSAFYVKIGLL